ncbi:hypothetical protein [Pseudomonas alloputida]|uniref:hypothetical protein n=1 Tax=Pseudomonas TaxID=286 RepID=UPI003EEDD2A6
MEVLKREDFARWQAAQRLSDAITLEEQKALSFAGKVFLELCPLALRRALQSGVLMEVCCEQQNC